MRGDTEPATGPDATPSWLASRRIDLWVLGGAVVAYVATYLAFFPPISSTEDEASYLAEADAIRHGHLTLDSLHQGVVQTFSAGGHLVSQYPPGMPALLAAASVVGWTPALGVNLVVSLAICAVVVQLLRRHRLPASFAILALLYPTSVLFSQTVLSDLFSGLLVALAILCVLDRRPVVVGLLLGVAVLVRDANVVACVTIPAGVLFDLWRGEEAGARLGAALHWLGRFVAGLIPGAVIAAVVYYAVDGGLALQYTGQFALHFLPHHLPPLVIGLVLMYPLMIFAPLVFRSPVRTPVALTCYGFLVVYGAWFFEGAGSTRLETFVVSERFMLVVAPLFVVAYADLLWRALQWLGWERLAVGLRAAVVILVALVLVGGSVVVQRDIHRHSETLATVRSALLHHVGRSDLLIVDKEVAKLFVPQYARRQIYIVDLQTAAQVRRDVGRWRAGHQPGQRVFVVDWSAGGLGGEIGQDRSAVGVVGQDFTTVPLSDAAEGLPAGVDLRQVTNP